MRRAALAWCVVAIASIAAGTGAARSETRFTKGLLWRGSKAGTAPSYVFGTIHVADPRVLDIPDPVSRALARSRRYYMESVQGAREAARLLEAGQFEDERRLEPLIGADAYAKVAAMLRDR